MFAPGEVPGAMVGDSGASRSTRELPLLPPRSALSCPATQAVLPLYRGQLSPVHAPRFAHPAEAQLAQIFSFYGIRCAYEPTTFALTWHGDGRPSEMFTPDFYLPDHQLYVELTTMRQRLVTRKNRKVRLLTETYPNARVKLVYRRDFLRLVQCVRRARVTAEESAIEHMVWDEDAIDARLAELTAEIAPIVRTSPGSPILLALGRGALRFQHELHARLAGTGQALDREQVRLITTRTPEGVGRVRLCRSRQSRLAGRSAILLTDIVSTGLSLRYAQDWLARHDVDLLWTCALLDRASARLVDVRIDATGFTAPNDVLGGFGLSLQPALAHLPYIGLVRSPLSDVPLI